jgi:hypothetical protein
VPDTIKKGTEFNHIYADSRPRWKVTRSRGRGVWEARIVSDDWTGVSDVFDEKDILTAIRQSEFFDDLMDEDQAFWNAQPVGKTIHYHNGFRQFVRGIVVEENGEKRMLPKALVGDWGSHDLPHRLINGKIQCGYHASKILSGETMHPNITSIYEATPTCGRGVDPTILVPLSLDVPEMTATQKALAAKEKLREELRSVLSERNVEVALQRARELLKDDA